MSRLLLMIPALLSADVASASLIQYFKDDQGQTNWQYVANFSSGVLILLLSITAIILFFSQRRARRANRALEEIRNALEDRVQERTATLNESNRLLQEANRLLEGEIAHHKETTHLLRSSEAYIKNILESMPLMLVGLNKDMVVTQWNRGAEEITGMASDQVIGRDLWQAYPTITVSPDQVAQVFNEQKPVVVKQSQRGQYYFDITIYPLRGQIETGVVILIDDVTQRTMAENMLIQRDKMSSMGELASTMAHDINVPLQAILKDVQALQDLWSNAETSIDNSLGSRIHGLLANAAEKGRQASGTITNLLSFAHSQDDHKELVDITDIIDHAIELAEDIISEPSGLHFRDITVETQYEDKLPQVPGYASELQQVFLSLFRHACHALGRKKQEGFTPLIKVEVIECYDAVWIRIQHNGMGLTSEEQQDIFEPFFKNTAYDNNNDAAKRLSFSYFIISEHHRGQMAVTSDPAVGTTFHMQLQLK